MVVKQDDILLLKVFEGVKDDLYTVLIATFVELEREIWQTEAQVNVVVHHDVNDTSSPDTVKELVT